MYKLLIISKVSNKEEYATGYGSQFDVKHLDLLIKNYLSKNIKIKIIDYKINIFSNLLLKYYSYVFDGILFIGLSNQQLKNIHIFKDNDLYLWGFNWLTWINNKKDLSRFSIVFEQAFKDLSPYKNYNQKTFYMPLAFQHDRIVQNTKRIYQLAFFGTLNRDRRKNNKDYRFKILKGLLDRGISVVNFNGRSKMQSEMKYLDKLKNHNNFKVIHSFGEPEDYSCCEYVLNLPFHEYGEDENIKWGMSIDEIENTNWLIHWETFKCIGTRSNFITHKCEANYDIGLNDQNCHLYDSTPNDPDKIIQEVEKIVKSNLSKRIDDKTWENNTYKRRMTTIISIIKDHINRNSKNEK